MDKKRTTVGAATKMIVLMMITTCLVGCAATVGEKNGSAKTDVVIESTYPIETTETPTAKPTPTTEPTVQPTVAPTPTSTPAPTPEPTVEPTVEPTQEPTQEPTVEPTPASVVTEEAAAVEEVQEVAEASAPETVETQPHTVLPDDVVSYVEYGGYIGRFSVPSVGIDVAMYNEYTQSATDRRDSAAVLHLPQSNESVVIADHSNQSFSVLPDVSVGDTAMVTLSDGNVIYYQCVDIKTGKNVDYIDAPYDLVDGNGHSVYGDSDLLTYTCYPHDPDVILVMWNKI